MIFTQDDVDKIVKRAKELGAGDGLDYKNHHLKLEMYSEPHDESVLAMLIINGWHDKHDLIAATQALTEYVIAYMRNQYGDCGEGFNGDIL